MPLGIDATIRYGLDIPGTKSLTKEALRSTVAVQHADPPGLPPTPIANPGLASIRAAANPARGRLPLLRPQAEVAVALLHGERDATSCARSASTATPATELAARGGGRSRAACAHGRAPARPLPRTRPRGGRPASRSAFSHSGGRSSRRARSCSRLASNRARSLRSTLSTFMEAVSTQNRREMSRPGGAGYSLRARLHSPRRPYPRMIEIRGTTTLVGLLGWPTSHSLSPPMQNAGFAALGLDWAYVPLPTPPERLGDAVRGLVAAGFAGANVTIPHKEAVIGLCDELDEFAERAGSVNTLVIEDGRVLGSSTDGLAVTSQIEASGTTRARARDRRRREGRRGGAGGRGRRGGRRRAAGPGLAARSPPATTSSSTRRRSRTRSSSRRFPTCRSSISRTTPTGARPR